MADSVAVKIPKDVYEGVEERVGVTEFKSVEEYVTYVLREVLKQVADKEPEEAAYSKEDEKRVKERLRALGYLD